MAGIEWQQSEDDKLLPLLASSVPRMVAMTIIPGRSWRAVQVRLTKLRQQRGITTNAAWPAYESDDEFNLRQKRAAQSNELMLAALRKAGFLGQAQQL